MTSYRDILKRTERKRPDGRPVWPLLPEDRPSMFEPLPQEKVA